MPPTAERAGFDCTSTTFGLISMFWQVLMAVMGIDWTRLEFLSNTKKNKLGRA